MFYNDYILTNSSGKLSPGAVNRGDVCNFMILFDVKDYCLLYGSISLSPHSEKIYT